MLEKGQFSSRQWKKGNIARCVGCVSTLQAAGKEGLVKVANHRWSTGMIDGKSHKVSKRLVKDRARRPHKEDHACAQDALDVFDSNFQLEFQSIEDIARLGYDDESYKRFCAMPHLGPLPPLAADTRYGGEIWR